MSGCLRVAFLKAIPVNVRFKHLIQEPVSTTPPRLLSEHEKVHDSTPRFERVLFDVRILWRGNDSIDGTDRIESVVNFAPVFKLLTQEIHDRYTATAPLEALVDLVLQKAQIDQRVVAVHVCATRDQIMLAGNCGVSRCWLRNGANLADDERSIFAAFASEGFHLANVAREG